MHSDSRSLGAEWLTSPRVRMPTIRLLLLITGNLRTCSFSMCRTALARSSSFRQQWMPGVITSRAVARLSNALPPTSTRAWSVVSSLDANKRPQLRHAARQARLLRSRHYGTDVLVGAGRFLRHAARGGATDHDPLRGQIVDDFAA